MDKLSSLLFLMLIGPPLLTQSVAPAVQAPDDRFSTTVMTELLEERVTSAMRHFQHR